MSIKPHVKHVNVSSLAGLLKIPAMNLAEEFLYHAGSEQNLAKQILKV